MGIDSLQEVGQFLDIDLLHVGIALIGVGKRIGDISQAVRQFQERGIGCLSDALVIAVVGSLLACSSFLIRQGIGHLCRHLRLIVVHKEACTPFHVVIGQTCILYTVVVIGSEEQGQDIVFARTDQVSVFHHGVGHHVQMEAVGMGSVIALVHAVVEQVCPLSDFLDSRPEYLYHGLEFLFRHAF